MCARERPACTRLTAAQAQRLQELRRSPGLTASEMSLLVMQVLRPPGSELKKCRNASVRLCAPAQELGEEEAPAVRRHLGRESDTRCRIWGVEVTRSRQGAFTPNFSCRGQLAEKEFERCGRTNLRPFPIL